MLVASALVSYCGLTSRAPADVFRTPWIQSASMRDETSPHRLGTQKIEKSWPSEASTDEHDDPSAIDGAEPPAKAIAALPQETIAQACMDEAGIPIPICTASRRPARQLSRAPPLSL